MGRIVVLLITIVFFTSSAFAEVPAQPPEEPTLSVPKPKPANATTPATKKSCFPERVVPTV